DDGFTYRVWADPTTRFPFDGPQGTAFTPHPAAAPAPLDLWQVPMQQVTLQNLPFSRNDPWLPPDATSTVGNNVDAYADLGGGDGFQPGFDLRAPLTGEGPSITPTTSPGLRTRRFRSAMRR